MLLPRDVPCNVEHERTQSDNRLRRGVSGVGAVNAGASAADKYIAERELKRQTIADIARHRRCLSSDAGVAQFAGTRQIDGELLALLKRKDEVIVLPIDAHMFSKMRRLAIGASVMLSAQGVILSGGHSR